MCLISFSATVGFLNRLPADSHNDPPPHRPDPTQSHSCPPAPARSALLCKDNSLYQSIQFFFWWSAACLLASAFGMTFGAFLASAWLPRPTRERSEIQGLDSDHYRGGGRVGQGVLIWSGGVGYKVYLQNVISRDPDKIWSSRFACALRTPVRNFWAQNWTNPMFSNNKTKNTSKPFFF